jgi:hypothetical protein
MPQPIKSVTASAATHTALGQPRGALPTKTVSDMPAEYLPFLRGTTAKWLAPGRERVETPKETTSYFRTAANGPRHACGAPNVGVVTPRLSARAQYRSLTQC